MQSFKSVRSLFVGFVFFGVATFAASSARASEVFPAALQEAASMPCTPSCVVCHGKTPGDLASFQVRMLPRNLIASGMLPAPGTAGVATLKSDFAAYAAKAATDPEVARVVAALKEGTDPETGDSLCGPSYGCGAHVAKKAPPSDLSAPLWVAFAMTLGVLFRRRRPHQS